MQTPRNGFEEAALWKAMHDEYGDEIAVMDASQGGVCFGRAGKKGRNHVSDDLPWQRGIVRTASSSRRRSGRLKISERTGGRHATTRMGRST